MTTELLINTNTVSILNQSYFLSDPGSEHTLGGQTPLRFPLMLKMKRALCHRSSSARADGWTARLETRTESETNREKHIREWQNFLSKSLFSNPLQPNYLVQLSWWLWLKMIWATCHIGNGHLKALALCKVTIINTVHSFSSKHIKSMDFFIIERIDAWLTNDVIDIFPTFIHVKP